ncbi:hypothetical protein [Kitasatospora purpeofusca]|uniref:hypothetical protein n=1 Tax=Kitasatospora purpeofusca TaxID=67352 RepID=UPI002B1D04C2|nr:hypothetical protein [Kitasatospora purpeofusca]
MTAAGATSSRCRPLIISCSERAGGPGRSLRGNGHTPHLTGRWPTPLGLPLDRLGPEDGTAVGAVLTDCADVSVVNGRDTLRLSLRADADVPVSVALWRNLGGYPATGPYRSIGVEPILGAVFDLAEAGRGDAAVVPAAGDLRWELTLTAGRTPSPSCEGTP